MTNTDQHPYAPEPEVLPPEAKPQPQAQGKPQEKPADKPAAPQMSVDDWKRTVCAQLEKIASNQDMSDRLLKMAGGDASRVVKNFTAFKMVIMRDEGGSRDDKKYFYQCTIASLWACFVESMNMQLPFDSRKLVHMEIYKSGVNLEAKLDIDYRGFVNALNRHYKNAFVECKLVFDKDVFTADIKERTAQYVHQPVDPFAYVKPNFDGIKGGYCFFSYTDTDGKYTSRLVFLSKEQIVMNKSKARSKKVWDDFPKQQAEKTCIREGSKLPFAAIDMEIDIEEVANRHYLLEKPDGNSDLKLLLAAQKEVVHGKDNVEPDDKGAANTVDGNAKPAAKTDTPAPEKKATGVDDGAGSNPQNAAPADNGKPVVPADEPEPAARGYNDGGGLRPLEGNQASTGAVIENEPQPKNIDDAEFEEGKP